VQLQSLDTIPVEEKSWNVFLKNLLSFPLKKERHEYHDMNVFEMLQPFLSIYLFDR